MSARASDICAGDSRSSGRPGPRARAPAARAGSAGAARARAGRPHLRGRWLGAGWLTGYGPNAINVRQRLQGPSWQHLLGTDHLGRDIFTRVLFGGRIALGVALASTGLALVAGLALGLLAGYGPRWLDNLLLLVFDTCARTPRSCSRSPSSPCSGRASYTVVLVIVVTTMPNYGRIVRTQTLSLKTAEFVLAERTHGRGAADACSPSTSCRTSWARS